MARRNGGGRGGRGSSRGSGRSGRSSRGEASESKSSSGRGSGRSGRSSSRGKSKGGDSNFIKVGDLTVTKKCQDNQEEVLGNIVELIEDGADLIEVLQLSGLQLSCNFYLPKDVPEVVVKSEDRMIVTFKEPHEKAPEYLVASASLAD